MLKTKLMKLNSQLIPGIIILIAIPVSLFLIRQVQNIKPNAAISIPVSVPTSPTPTSTTSILPNVYIESAVVKFFDQNFNPISENNVPAGSTVFVDASVKVRATPTSDASILQAPITITVTVNGKEVGKITDSYQNILNTNNIATYTVQKHSFLIEADINMYGVVLDIENTLSEQSKVDNYWGNTITYNPVTNDNFLDLNNDNVVDISDYTLYISGFITQINK